MVCPLVGVHCKSKIRKLATATRQRSYPKWPVQPRRAHSTKKCPQSDEKRGDPALVIRGMLTPPGALVIVVGTVHRGTVHPCG